MSLRAKRSNPGFTLIEILIVIGILAILFSIVIVAVNPARQFAQARNTQRRSDILAILNGVNQYMADHDGIIPAVILEDATTTCADADHEICQHNQTCGAIDLDFLADDAAYLTTIPDDPIGSSGTRTGYHIIKDYANRITVCAPDAELNITIQVKR